LAKEAKAKISAEIYICNNLINNYEANVTTPLYRQVVDVCRNALATFLIKLMALHQRVLTFIPTNIRDSNMAARTRKQAWNYFDLSSTGTCKWLSQDW